MPGLQDETFHKYPNSLVRCPSGTNSNSILNEINSSQAVKLPTTKLSYKNLAL